MTNLVLTAAFLGVALIVWAAAALADHGFLSRWWAPALIATALLFALTALFDNVMIWAGLTQYASDRVSGVSIGSAPIEDFAYPLAAVLLLPALWSLLARRHEG